jgi:hypothetical protein
MSADLRIGAIDYKIGKLNVKQQAKVVRKLMPFAKAIIPFVVSGDGKPKAAAMTSDQLVGMLGPLGDMVAAMPDKDWDDLVSTCLSVVRRQDGIGWQTVWNMQADMPQYADIELPEMLQLMGGVLRYNLGPFMAALPQLSPSEPPTPSEP